ncbi:response regulator [soil metagenome]|jgi:CheY-like chemotaxis protein
MKKIEIACIIDDDPIYVFCTKRIMQMASFCESFLIFHNGKEALDRLKAIILRDENLPEIILLDLNMPVMDGWEFLDEFTKVPASKQITIYIVTSSIDPADVERAKEYDTINNYIVKPVTVDTLKEILKEFVQA